MRSKTAIVSNNVAKEATMDFLATSRSDPAPWRPRILLIEDDAGVRDLIELLLLEEGFHMTCWHDVQDVRKVAGNWPDLIVLDLLIAGSDAGWEFLQELSNDRMTEHIPVVVCTAHIPLVKREEQRLRDLAAGVMLKPFDVDELFAMITSALERKTYKSGGWRDESSLRLPPGSESVGGQRFQELQILPLAPWVQQAVARGGALGPR